MRSSSIRPFSSCPDSSSFFFLEKKSHITAVQSVAQPAISSSSSFSPIVTRAVSWEEDSRLSPAEMSLDDKSFYSEDSQEFLGTCESLASDESREASVSRKRKRESELDCFVIEIEGEQNADLEERFWDSDVFLDAKMTIPEALQRTFGPLCQNEKMQIEAYKKFLDFLCENLQEERFFEQKSFLSALYQKNLFRIEDVNRPVYLKQSFDNIEKQLIKVLRTLSQEKIRSLLSQRPDLNHVLERSSLYQEIDSLLPSYRIFHVKDRLYKFPKKFARLGYDDEAIALVAEFSSLFPDRLSESRVLSAIAKILAKEGRMGSAVKALNAIELDSVRQEFLSHLQYVE